MTSQDQPTHDDGVRVVRTAGGRRLYWLLGAAIVLPIVGTLVAIAVIRSSSGAAAKQPAREPGSFEVARVDAPPTAAATPARAGATHVTARRVVAEPVADPAAPGGLGASPVPHPQKPQRDLDAADAIAALREEGIHTGIAAFGIPGSNPPKSGILVPEDFSLPEGYVRHYQSTDDGEQLPAILMFHPDYEFLNEHGEVVPLPEDLVVPPEMAPPGLATDQVLQVPERKAGEPVH